MSKPPHLSLFCIAPLCLAAGFGCKALGKLEKESNLAHLDWRGAAEAAVRAALVTAGECEVLVIQRSVLAEEGSGSVEEECQIRVERFFGRMDSTERVTLDAQGAPRRRHADSDGHESHAHDVVRRRNEG